MGSKYGKRASDARICRTCATYLCTWSHLEAIFLHETEESLLKSRAVSVTGRGLNWLLDVRLTIAMAKKSNIIIADESALFLYDHIATLDQCKATIARINPLPRSASCGEDFHSFNAAHPLYGGTPVSVLVNDASARRQSGIVSSRYCPYDLPTGSFYKLRDNLYLASPELVFARMGNFISEMRLAETGLNLCGRYYKNLDTGKIDDRRELLTTPERIEQYLKKVPDLRGSGKARKALRWVVGNSGSPMESKVKLQFANPLWTGSMGLPFTHMNYDVTAGRLTGLTKQNDFCIDLANPILKEGLEYDGEESHLDPSKDKRRRNALEALGWHVTPIDKSVLYNPEATKQAGLQIARRLGMRIQFPKHWEEKFEHLRKELELPV